jgi:hypothetical protein
MRLTFSMVQSCFANRIATTKRWTALGEMGDRLIVVVFTWRAEVIRVISARRARKNEEAEYRNAKMG